MRIVTKRPVAIARVRGNKDNADLTGTVRFFQYPGGILVEADVVGLPANSTGFHGFHIHDGESCKGAGFPASGSHLNITGAVHPRHAGDLPPLLSCNGRAYTAVMTDRFSLRDILGRTVVIHKNADDLVSQPAGNSGEKIACGVIEKM